MIPNNDPISLRELSTGGERVRSPRMPAHANCTEVVLLGAFSLVPGTGDREWRRQR